MHESAAELRRSFIDFFTARGHRVVPSSPIIPVGDPTLLFTTAGMVQFKPLYGARDPEFPRAVSVQKCLRATDIDQIGHTLRHHTFLEMLGNFSFGDYFKKKAIELAWEYTREVVNLDRSRIWVSVHTSDEEAARLWEKETDLLPGRIVPLGDKDNFWGPAGTTGACGPSSELYWDLGEDVDRGGREGALGESDRYLEFWNLVFPQFNQDGAGTRVPLARPGIDTGMGLERLAMITQEVGSTYETDLLRPLVERILEIARLPEMPAGDQRVAVRIVADHARALAFAIAAGVVPGNEGRGYVIRRILRRASRRGRALGITTSFLDRVCEVVIALYADPYPELKQMEEAIMRVTRAEEERFARTLDAGMERFAAITAERRASGATTLSGADVFQLYDTYGFPVDLTEEMAGEQGLDIDRSGFESAMEEQRERGRQAHRFHAGAAAGGGAPWTPVTEGRDSEFRGYETLTLEATTRRVRGGGREGEVELVLDETPFYAESGGQVGDQGEIEGEQFLVQVTDTVVEAVEGEGETRRSHVHRGRLVRGSLADVAGGSPRVTARVDAARRAAIMRNHTATHLLHAALREVLGSHVQQAGSLVAPDRLRFDFTHFAALSGDEQKAIEEQVNEQVLANTPVEVRVESYDAARERGAMALFGEKYSSEVRTVGVPGFSLELCGGTHCRTTGDIGLFKIVSESAVGAGMRRIEALTGIGSLRWLGELEGRLAQLSELLGVSGGAGLVERLRSLVKENAELRQKLKAAAGGGLDKLVEQALAGAEETEGHRVVAARIEVDSVDLFRRAGDALRDRLRSGAGVLATVMGGKVSFLAVVTDDLIQSGVIRADEIVREVAEVAGGSGGGKPHQAMGSGGRNVDRIDAALDRGRSILLERLKGGPRSKV
jgi:alanyl-tRNA synthetase